MSALRRHATTLVLVALAAALAVVLFVLDRGAVSTDEASARARNLFPAWRPDDITELTVEAAGREARLARTLAQGGAPGEWSVTVDGVTYPADPQTVDDYLGKLRYAVHERRVAAGSVDRAAAGLDAPALSVGVTMGPLAYRLALGGGAATPPGARYAEIGGEVIVVSAQLAASLEIGVDRFRSRTFLPYFSSDLSAIALEGAGGERRRARGAWGGGRGAGGRFDEGGPSGGRRVAAAAMDRLLGALGLMEAESFLSDADADRAAAKRVTLTLVPKDAGQKRAVIELGGACPASVDQVVAIRREPTRASACVPKGVLESLSVPAGDLADARLLGAPLDEVTELKITALGRSLELARAASSWHLRAPADRDVPADLGRDLVEGLLGIEARGFVEGDPVELGLASPRATLRLVSAIAAGPAGGGEAERVEILELGAEKGDVAYVRRKEDGAVLEIPRERARELTPTELSLRSRKVIDEPLKRFRSLRLTRGAEVQSLERTDTGAWRLLEPKGEGLRADIGLASDLAAALGDLSAERWVADEDDGGFGLASPRLVLEAEIGDDPEDRPADAAAPERRKVRVRVGGPADRGSFAALDGDPAVFVVPQRLELIADRLLLDRGVLMVEPGRIARVTLTAPGAAGAKRLVVERSGQALRIQGASPDDPTAARRAAAVRDTLADLLAEGATSVGAPKKHEGLDKPTLEVSIELTGGERPLRFRFGAGDALRATSICYARRDGVDATYAVAQAKVRALLDAM